MRAATWAKAAAATAPFARAVYHREFAAGADISDPAVLADAAEAAGLDPAALDDPAIKQRLKDATSAAWAAGVRGVPTVIDGDTVLYGDGRISTAPRPGSG
jgi:2-hydroxychromene-2-carboxylate isomerase